MPGPRSHREVRLDAEQRAELVHIAAETASEDGRARRAEIVLKAADGVRIRVIAREVGVRRDVVRKWIDRFIAQGLTGLDDAPRPGRPRRAASPPRTEPSDPESYSHVVPDVSTARFDWSSLNPLRRAEVERALSLLGLIAIGRATVTGAGAITTA